MTPLAAVARALHGQPARAPAEPWLAWLLVCLCRHQARQAWGHLVYHQRLLRCLDEDRWAGPVPGVGGWTYELDDDRVTLLGPAGERLVLERVDDGPEWINPLLLGLRIRRLDPPPPPEGQLRAWLPNTPLLGAAIGALHEQGLVERRHASGGPLRLTGPLRSLAPEVAAVDFAERATMDRWVEHLGAGDAGFAAWVRARVGGPNAGYDLLPNVGHVFSPEQLAELCVAQLAQGGSAAGKALELLADLPGDHSAAVLAFVAGVDPARAHPYAPTAAARYLLTRGVESARMIELVVALGAVREVPGYRGNPFDDDIALLLLEFAPERAIGAIRRALREGSPMSVNRVAAVLATLDQRWCHRELEAAIRRPDAPPHAVRPLLAALAASGSAVARARARQLAPPIERHEGGVGFTFDEVTVSSLGVLFTRALERAGPLAARLDLPEDFGAG